MGIFDRLGTLFKSYVNDVGGDEGVPHVKRARSGDPDLDAAFDELNDYLKHDHARDGAYVGRGQSYGGAEYGGGYTSANYNAPPQELAKDFAVLGVPFGADAETCKRAYRSLLKRFHPDRFAGRPQAEKDAAQAKSAEFNSAYDRIENWRKSINGAGA